MNCSTTDTTTDTNGTPTWPAPPDFAVEVDELMARIHARLPDGNLVEGVEVFRLMYAAAARGLGPLVALTRLPGVTQLLDASYTWFAKNRLRLTGRCATDACTPRSTT